MHNMEKCGRGKGRPQGCSLRSHRRRRLAPLPPPFSPAPMLRHVVYASLLHFGVETAELKKTRIATFSNICIVTKVWESGTAWYARELARGLIELGVRVALVAPAFKPSELELDLTDDQQSLFLRRKTTREDNSNPNKIFRYWSKLLRILDGVIAVVRLRSKFKIYLFSMPDPIISPLLFLLLRLSGARVLLVVHDPFPH
jgi:hypothetical protein